MDYATKSREELIALCKERGLKGYSTKKKDELINLLSAQVPNKKTRGQFYTTNSDYILEGLPTHPLAGARCVIEPFAGKGDLLQWLQNKGNSLPVEAYDIEPKAPNIIQRDTLLNPPDYSNAWIITNPPYLARNKSEHKDIYDKYDTNDLYKCFISSLKDKPCGGILIIPAGFFLSPRDIDVRCRQEFMSQYKILKVKYFEETVFDDTTTTIVAFAFERASQEEPLAAQDVLWETLPTKATKTFHMSAANNWIIGGDIYNLPTPDGIQIRRHVEGQPLKTGEQQTFITLNALDSGTQEGRISLTYKSGYVYPAKECSRTYATLRITGRVLTEEEQQQVCERFNTFLEEKRAETWSLFLPQFRESKLYARKRIPFELAYRILSYLI
jgi:hypothetical protein